MRAASPQRPLRVRLCPTVLGCPRAPRACLLGTGGPLSVAERLIQGLLLAPSLPLLLAPKAPPPPPPPPPLLLARLFGRLRSYLLACSLRLSQQQPLPVCSSCPLPLPCSSYLFPLVRAPPLPPSQHPMQPNARTNTPCSPSVRVPLARSPTLALVLPPALLRAPPARLRLLGPGRPAPAARSLL